MRFSFLGNVIDNHTLLYHIVKKTTNGDQIVLKILDDYVTTNSSTAEKIESYNYKLDNKAYKVGKLIIRPNTGCF